MKNLLRLLPVLALAAFLAGCEGPCTKIGAINGPSLTSGSADFSNYAAVGTSISAGYQSGGLVDRHQIHSFPALFAQQVGMTVLATGQGSFTFDGISHDGIPQLMYISSLSPLIISSTGRTTGAPENSSQQTDYHNLGLPGALAVDFVDSTYYTLDPNAVRGAGYNKTFFNLVYRSRGLGVIQLARRAPTFVTYEMGANEVLGAATRGSGTAFPVPNYVASVQAGLNTMHALLPNTKVAVFNVPGVTSIPFCTTFSPITINLSNGTPTSLIGPAGPLLPTDMVLLTAGSLLATGQGFPVGSYNYVNPAAPGTGVALPDAVVLSTAEVTSINTAIADMNIALDSLVANRPWTTMVDLHGLLADIAADGFRVGGTTYTSDFVTGGIFSLDGVHPTDLAHAVMCNTLIDAVNAKWGSTIPHLNVTSYATVSSSRIKLVDPEGRPVPMRIEGLGDGLQMLFGPVR